MVRKITSVAAMKIFQSKEDGTTTYVEKNNPEAKLEEVKVLRVQYVDKAIDDIEKTVKRYYNLYDSEDTRIKEVYETGQKLAKYKGKALDEKELEEVNKLLDKLESYKLYEVKEKYVPTKTKVVYALCVAGGVLTGLLLATKLDACSPKYQDETDNAAKTIEGVIPDDETKDEETSKDKQPEVDNENDFTFDEFEEKIKETKEYYQSEGFELTDEEIVAIVIVHNTKYISQETREKINAKYGYNPNNIWSEYKGAAKKLTSANAEVSYTGKTIDVDVTYSNSRDREAVITMQNAVKDIAEKQTIIEKLKEDGVTKEEKEKISEMVTSKLEELEGFANIIHNDGIGGLHYDEVSNQALAYMQSEGGEPAYALFLTQHCEYIKPRDGIKAQMRIDTLDGVAPNAVSVFSSYSGLINDLWRSAGYTCAPQEVQAKDYSGTSAPISPKTGEEETVEEKTMKIGR